MKAISGLFDKARRLIDEQAGTLFKFRKELFKDTIRDLEFLSESFAGLALFVKEALTDASGFVADFFGGSASELVTSLLGSKQLERDDIQRLRELLDSRLNKKSPKKTKE